jgi:hypothetical protein
LIVVMLGAGVVAIVAKNNKTTSTAQPKPGSTSSSVSTPTVAPSTSVKASNQVAPTNSLKKSPPDGLANVPPTPVTGVGRQPAGFVFVVVAAGLAVRLRRTARA